MPRKPATLLTIYNIFIRLYYLGIRVAALWNKKAEQWMEGRKGLFETLEAKVDGRHRWVWMHCSSAGEFEQGKPIAEALKKTHPAHKLLISFFSPSGFAVAKDYPYADAVCFLPLDTQNNAQRFVRLLKPELAIFVKYEFWYHHLSAAARQNVPLLLVSAAFRPGQVFFKAYGGFFRRIPSFFQHIFLQDHQSKELLETIGIRQCTVSGDTRFDRVAEIEKLAAPVRSIDAFLQGKKVLVAGSTWQDDEALLENMLHSFPETQLILAPHEVTAAHIGELRARFPDAVLYSERNTEGGDFLNRQVLIIDTVGLLSRLYRYADIAYVGGGFTKDGIHNILEAAVWAKPVVFGPNHQKYREAKGLIEVGGGFSVKDAEEAKRLTDRLLQEPSYRQAVGKKAKDYVGSNRGATEKILAYVQEKRLLTNW